MRFCFWQNMVSIHQGAFLSALAREHEVRLYVEQKMLSSRAGEGWNIPELEGVRIAEIPTDHQLSALMLEDGVHHVFSGIDAFPGVYRAFKAAVKADRDISVMCEPFNFFGVRGVLRIIKYRMLAARYGRRIRRLFPTGQLGIRSLRLGGLPGSKMFQWGYFTAGNTENRISEEQHKGLRWIYIGSLIERKHIVPFLKAFSATKNENVSMTIVGKGELADDVRAITEHDSRIRMVGSVDNKDICRIIGNHDLLVLPSLFDGWGAVVNEALTAGSRVLCSDRCGASVLIDEAGHRGRIFRLDRMAPAINEEMHSAPLTTAQRSDIARWAESHISGEAAAEYFAECFSSTDHKPTPPWLK